MPDIQEGGGLVQDNDTGVLTDGPGQKNALLLPVAYLRKIPGSKIPRMDHFHGLPDLSSVLCRQYAHPSGIWVAACAYHILTVHKLRVNPLCHQNGHPLCNLPLPHPLHGHAIQVNGPFQQSQLPYYASQNGGFTSPVWPDERHDFSRPNMNSDLPYQRRFAVSDGHIFCPYVIFCHEIRLSISLAFLLLFPCIFPAFHPQFSCIFAAFHPQFSCILPAFLLHFTRSSSASFLHFTAYPSGYAPSCK